MNIDKLHELIVLNKALWHVKFKSSDDDSAFLSNSPITNELLDRIKKSFIEEHGITIKDDQLKLKDHKEIKVLVLKKARSLHNWENFSVDIKKESILTMLYPYQISEAEIEELLNL